MDDNKRDENVNCYNCKGPLRDMPDTTEITGQRYCSRCYDFLFYIPNLFKENGELK